MKRYRFKTKEEFIEDDLWDYDYDCPNRWNSSGEMNHYMGKEITNPEIIKHCTQGNDFIMDLWYFRMCDYVKADVIYEPNTFSEKFEVGKWYTNPEYPEKYAYFRISSVYSHGNFHTIRFDAVADEHWNITEEYHSQANSDFEAKMKLVDHMALIQEEAKRRFPIGSRVRTLGADGFSYESTVNFDSSVYNVVGENIFSSIGKGCLFMETKWAEIIDTESKTLQEVEDGISASEKYLQEEMVKMAYNPPTAEDKKLTPVYSTTIKLKSKKSSKTLKL